MVSMSQSLDSSSSPSLLCLYRCRFKLHLRPNSTATSDAETIPPLPPNKSIIDIFADFMEYLFACARTYISENDPNGINFWRTLEQDIEFILTHPNGWEGAQQSQMRAAAIQAGLVSDDQEGRARVHFVTEGEASLHFCIQNGLGSYASDVSLKCLLFGDLPVK